MSGNFRHRLHPRAMTTAEAAQAMAKLAHLATQGMALALGLWRGTVTGTESGNPHPGEHVAVFTDETLFAPFGPQGNQASEAGAVLLILAARTRPGLRPRLAGRRQARRSLEAVPARDRRTRRREVAPR